MLSLKIFIYLLCAVHKLLAFLAIEGVIVKIFKHFFYFLKNLSMCQTYTKSLNQHHENWMVFLHLQKIFEKQKCQKIKQNGTWRFLLQFIVTKWMGFQKIFFYKIFSYDYRLQVLLKIFCHNEIIWVSRLQIRIEWLAPLPVS